MNKGFIRTPSLRVLLNQTPFDGCLLLFNAPYHQVRQRCSELGVLTASRVDDGERSRAIAASNTLVDMYVRWKS